METSLLRILKALAEPQRLRMIQELAAAGELSCGQVGERFTLSQPTISHHLKILSEAGLLVVRREAQHAFVSVNQRLLDRVLKPLPARALTRPSRAARREGKTTSRHERRP
jgi:DNA-binding transcriptional ArsR family regulator